MLTVCTTADAVPKALANDKPILEFINRFAHIEKAFIGLAYACKRVKEGV
jgi:hypothetical protein